MPGKLGRPSKRHTGIEVIKPSGKKKGDTYEVPDDSPHKAATRSRTNVLSQEAKRTSTRRGPPQASPAVGKGQSTSGQTQPKHSRATPPHTSANMGEVVNGVHIRRSTRGRKDPTSLHGPITPKTKAPRRPQVVHSNDQPRGADKDPDGQVDADGKSKSSVGETGSENDKENDEESAFEDESADGMDDERESDDSQVVDEGPAIPQSDDVTEESGAHRQARAKQTNGAKAGKVNQKQLLGQDDDWEQVCDGVKKNFKSLEADKIIFTKTMQDLVAKTKVVKALYKNIILQKENHQANSDDTSGKLKDCLNDLEDTVRKFSWEKPVKKAEEMVKDLYVNVVPQLVFLLRCAMICRGLQSSRRAYDVEGLEEILCIQQIILSLCTKAFSWKVKPVTQFPITKNIKSKVYPYLRHMKKNFEKELQAEKRHEQMRRNKERIGHRHKARPESVLNSAQEQSESSIERCNRMLMESMEVEERRFLPRARAAKLRKKHGDGRNPANSQPPPREAWTDEEDQALKYELLTNREANKLPRGSSMTWSKYVD